MPLAARFLVLTLALMAATCGQKGPLTPPDRSGLTAEAAAEDVASARVQRADTLVIEAARSA